MASAFLYVIGDKMITITDKAVKEMFHIMQESDLKPEETHLRLAVRGGGCSGFQTVLNLDNNENYKEEKDTMEEVEGVKIVMDKRSAMYLDGAVVDFHEDINKRGFIVDVPGAKGKCGCGSSFNF